MLGCAVLVLFLAWLICYVTLALGSQMRFNKSIPACNHHSQDNDIDVGRIDPPFRHRSIGQVKALTAQALMPLSVKDDKEYYISVPYGNLVQKQVWLRHVHDRHLSYKPNLGNRPPS